jgi:hypothetical protein
MTTSQVSSGKIFNRKKVRVSKNPKSKSVVKIGSGAFSGLEGANGMPLELLYRFKNQANAIHELLKP